MNNQTKMFETYLQNVFQLEISLLKYNGPSLGKFATLQTDISLFQPINPQSQQNFSFCQNNSGGVSIQISNQSNIQVFYYILLCVCFDEFSASSQSENILNNIKRLIYNPQTRLKIYKDQEINQNHLEFYNDFQMKKLLVQFLQILNYNRAKSSIIKMLHRYPIINFILNLSLRSIVCNRYNLQVSSFEDRIQNEYLVRLFRQFQINIQQYDSGYEFTDINMVFCQDQQKIILYPEQRLSKKLSHLSTQSVQIDQSQIPQKYKGQTKDQIPQDAPRFIQFNNQEPKIIICEEMENFSFGKKQNIIKQNQKKEIKQIYDFSDPKAQDKYLRIPGKTPIPQINQIQQSLFINPIQIDFLQAQSKLKQFNRFRYQIPDRAVDKVFDSTQRTSLRKPISSNPENKQIRIQKNQINDRSKSNFTVYMNNPSEVKSSSKLQFKKNPIIRTKSKARTVYTHARNPSAINQFKDFIKSNRIEQNISFSKSIEKPKKITINYINALTDTPAPISGNGYSRPVISPTLLSTKFIKY